MVPSLAHMPILCEPGHTFAARCRPQFLCNSGVAPLRGDSPYPIEELSAAAGQAAVVVVVVAVLVVQAEVVKVLKLGSNNYETLLCILRTLHDPKYLKPWESWYYSMLGSCRMAFILRRSRLLSSYSSRMPIRGTEFAEMSARNT